MDRGAWKAAVHGVTKIWTRLNEHTHTHTQGLHPCDHIKPNHLSTHDFCGGGVGHEHSIHSTGEEKYSYMDDLNI